MSGVGDSLASKFRFYITVKLCETLKFNDKYSFKTNSAVCRLLGPESISSKNIISMLIVIKQKKSTVKKMLLVNYLCTKCYVFNNIYVGILSVIKS